MGISMITWTLSAVVVSLLVYVYLWVKKRYRYWEKKGVASSEPVPPFGHLLPVLIARRSLNEYYGDFYRDFPKEKLVGAYEIVEPVLIIRDKDIMEQIMVKEFQHFVDHPVFGNDDGVFSKGLFNLTGNLWRSVRYKISPTFTSGKLKAMFDQMENCGDEMVEQVRMNKTDCKYKDVLNVYSLNVVASTVFGIEIKDKKLAQRFFKMSNMLFYSGFLYSLRQIFITIFPKMSKHLKIRFFPPEVEEFFNGMIASTFEQREKSNVQRNDYLNQLINLKRIGKIDSADKDAEDNYLNIENHEDTKIELSNEIIYGQAMQFLLAGFDPLVNVSAYTMFELSQHPEVQEKARKELQDLVIKKGKFSYDMLKSAVYLDQCIYETLRTHSLVELIQRLCTKTYTTPDGVEIEAGTRIVIPVKAMNHDPQYFEDPHVFDPSRFDKDKTIPFVYAPFGIGPRICIGMRYAMVQMKVALAKILLNYNVTLSKKTKLPLEFNKFSFVPMLKSDIMFDFTPIKN